MKSFVAACVVAVAVQAGGYHAPSYKLPSYQLSYRKPVVPAKVQTATVTDFVQTYKPKFVKKEYTVPKVAPVKSYKKPAYVKEDTYHEPEVYNKYWSPDSYEPYYLKKSHTRVQYAGPRSVVYQHPAANHGHVGDLHHPYGDVNEIPLPATHGHPHGHVHAEGETCGCGGHEDGSECYCEGEGCDMGCSLEEEHVHADGETCGCAGHEDGSECYCEGEGCDMGCSLEEVEEEEEVYVPPPPSKYERALSYAHGRKARTDCQQRFPNVWGRAHLANPHLVRQNTWTYPIYGQSMGHGRGLDTPAGHGILDPTLHGYTRSGYGYGAPAYGHLYPAGGYGGYGGYGAY